MTMSAAAAAEEAGKAANVTQLCRAINKDIVNALTKKLLKSAPPGTHGQHLRARVERHLEKLLPTIKTPDHPPYALMIRQAITELNEKGGSDEEAISEFIELNYKDLPWAHANFLKHHLKKLKEEEEIFQVSGNCYKLSLEVDDSTDTVKKSKKHKGRHGKEEDDRQRKVSKSDGFSEEKNFVAEEDQEQNGAVGHFKESEVQQKQSNEQQKQEVTCGSRQESVLGLEGNEEVNQVHMEECERMEDANREETLHQLKDAGGLDKLPEQQQQEVTCVPRQETMLGVEVNEEVSQVHTREKEIVEDAGREALQNLKDAEQQNQSGEQQKEEVACLPSQLAVLGSEIEEEHERTEDVNPTEASDHFISAEEQVQLQEQNQNREVDCLASQEIVLRFEVNDKVNQLCGQECERMEDVSQKEEENSLQIEGEKEIKEQSATIEEREELNSQQYATIEGLQQNEGINVVADTLIQVEEPSEMEEEKGLGIEGEREQSKAMEEREQDEVMQDSMIEDLQSRERFTEVSDTRIQVDEEQTQTEGEDGLAIEGEKEEREQIKANEEHEEVNCVKYTMVEDLHQRDGFNEVIDTRVQVEEESSLAIEGEKEETKKVDETEEPEEVNCEQEPLTVVQVEEHNQCQEELSVLKDQNQMRGTSGVSEEQNQENEGPKNVLTGEHIEGKVQEGLIEAEKVIAVEQPEQQTELQGSAGDFEEQNKNKGAENLLTEAQCYGSFQVGIVKRGQVQAVEQPKQKQDLQPEVNRDHLQLQEIGAEVEWIEKLVTPQRPLKEVVRNESEMRDKLFGREEEATNLISSHAGPSLRQVGSTLSDKGQCLELLNRTVKIQGMIVELLNSFCTGESSKSDLTMLESKESELSGEQLPNASCAAETELPSSMDMEVAEPRDNPEISNSTTASQIEEPMLDNHCQSLGKHPTFPGQQDDVKLSAASSMLNDLDVQGSSKLQKEVSNVNSAVEEATTPLLVDLNSSLYMPPSPSEQAVKNKEAKVVTAECHLEKFSQQKLPESQPDTILSIYYKEKEISGPTVLAESTLLSLLQTSQEQQQKPTDFVDGNQQPQQQKAEVPVQVLQQNAQQSSVQFGSPLFNTVLTENHARGEDDQQRLQPNLQGPKPPLGLANTIISFAPQQKPMLLQCQPREASQSIEQQQKQMLSPPGTRHFEGGTQTHVPSIFNTGSLFSQPLYQQSEPLSIEKSTSPLKAALLSGAKLQPLKPKEIKKLVQPQKQAPDSPKQASTLIPVINVDEIEVREPPSSYKKKLCTREDTSSSLGPSPSSDKAVAVTVAVAESESQKNEEDPQPKRKGRKPNPKPSEPGYTPPQSRPKIRQSKKKQLQTAASADGEEAALSSQSPAKRPRGRPPKVKVTAVEEEPIIIIPKNPFYTNLT